MSWWTRLNAFVQRQNPWIGVIGFFLTSLLTIYLAIPAKGVLGYRQSVIKIFDSKSAGELRIVGPNNQPIETDVYAVETTLKNAGSLAFDAGRVRRPVEIRFPKGTVVETRVSVPFADADIMQLDAMQEPSAADTVEVKWRNFDPGETAKITTLVASPVEVKPEIKGTIYRVRLAEAITSPYPVWYLYGALIVFGVASGFGTVTSFSELVASVRGRKFSKAGVAALMSIVSSAFFVFSIVGLFKLWFAPLV
jgi:hypothetical protein